VGRQGNVAIVVGPVAAAFLVFIIIIIITFIAAVDA